MPLPVRPVFQNGQRLTAERLNDAVDYLRSTLRRLALAPLSSGVAIGLNLTPKYPDASGTVVLTPGIAIDGRGRLLVFQNRQVFSAAGIEAELGSSLVSGDIIEMQLVLDETSSTTEGCSGNNEIEAVEGGTIRLVRVATESQRTQPSLNCVDPWGDLDTGSSAGTCGVVVGHIVAYDNGQLTATTEVRHGISAQLRAIRNVNGIEAMTFEAGLNRTTGAAEIIRALQPLVAEDQFVSNKEARFYGESIFDKLSGYDVQATHIGSMGTSIADQVAGLWPGDDRIFVVGGGAGGFAGQASVAVRQGGVTALQCRVHTDYGEKLTRPGIPLVADVWNGLPVVRELDYGDSPLKLVGLSAAAAVWTESADGSDQFQVVPLCTSGLVTVKILPGYTLSVGDPLTFNVDDITTLGGRSDTNILARVAQNVEPTGGDFLAWVVHMPQNLVESGS